MLVSATQGFSAVAGPELDVPQPISSVKFNLRNVIRAHHSVHLALLLAGKGGAQHEALMKNDEDIKEGVSSGIHLVDTNSSPCLEFNCKSSESVSLRLLIMKTHNYLQNDTAPVSTVRERQSTDTSGLGITMP